MALFTLKQIDHFRAVVDCGSFRAAAQSLNLTQPPLSRQIQQLEQALGAALFDRSERQITLTAEGHYLYRHSQQLVQTRDQLLAGFEAYARGESGELRIGLTDDFVASPIYAEILSFIAKHPGIRTEVVMAVSTRLLDRLLNRELDLVLANLPMQYDDNNVVTVPTPPTRFMVVLPATHAWAARSSLRVSDLQDQPLLLMPDHSDTPFALQYRRLFAAEEVRTAPCPVSDSPELQLQMVQRGLGLGLVTEHSIAGHHPEVVQIPLEHPLAMVQHGLLFMQDAQSPALQGLVERLRH
ncbi:MAG: LysR family transcriptional regulator [Pseudomonadota bacterium]